MFLIVLHRSTQVNALPPLIDHQNQTHSAASLLYFLFFSLFCNNRLIDFDGVESRLIDLDVEVTSIDVVWGKFLGDCLSVVMEVAVVDLIEVFTEIIEGHIENAIISTQS